MSSESKEPHWAGLYEWTLLVLDIIEVAVTLPTTAKLYTVFF